MTKLTDTQAIILSAAAQRPDGNILPLPGSLRGGAAGKVVGALLTRGFIREQPSDSGQEAVPARNQLWPNEEDGRGVLLRITPVGLAAIDMEPVAAHPAAPDGQFNSGTQSFGEAVVDPAGRAEAAPSGDRHDDGAASGKASTARTATRAGNTREGTKQALLVGMLRRAEGATIAEVVAATGWQPHTVRGAFAGALKKRLGLTVASEKVDGCGRVYRVAT